MLELFHLKSLHWKSTKQKTSVFNTDGEMLCYLAVMGIVEHEQKNLLN